MQQRQFGTTGAQVSELALGTMTFGREIDEADSAGILDAYVDAGGSFIDTADVYGTGASEEILGRLLKDRRDGIFLATKFRMPVGPGTGGASRRWIRQAVEDSLRRLDTEWIDLYQIHCWDETTPLEETLSTLNDLVREGKVRYLGASNYTGWQMGKAAGVAATHDWEPFVSLQPQYSLVTRETERELIPFCVSEGLAVLPWSPLGGGLLTGKYRHGEDAPDGTRAGDPTPSAALMRRRLVSERGFKVADVVGEVADAIGKSRAQVALNWVLYRPGVTSPILGARTLEQITDNLGVLGWQLDDKHCQQLDDASAISTGYPYEFINWIHGRA